MESSRSVRNHSRAIFRVWLLCYITLGFLGLNVFAGENRGQVCYTIDRIRGRCVPVKHCPHILDVLRQDVHTNEDIWLVYGSQCGSLPDGKALVCCVQNSTIASQTTATRTNMEDSNRNQPPASGISESATSSRPQCGIQSAARESIIEGTSRNIGFHPWSVLLHNGDRPRETKFPCTGTLISAEYVLTSAGCVDEVDKRVNLTAKLGEYDLESDVDCIFAGPNDDMFCAKPSYDVKVVEVLVHEAAGNRLHDIALLKLSEPVKIDEWVSPICLPESAAIDHSATYHSVSWNQNTCEDGSRRYKLLSNYSLTNVTACGRHLPAGSENNFMCVSSAGQPFVDVGGALTVTKTIDSNDGSRSVNELVGILSSTATCANYDGVLVYTKVGQYLEWIQDTLVNEESVTTRVQ